MHTDICNRWAQRSKKQKTLEVLALKFYLVLTENRNVGFCYFVTIYFLCLLHSI